MKQDRIPTEESDEITAIPKQWFPAPFRWFLRLLILPFVYLDLACQWLARKIVRPPYRRTGTCKQTGNCCKTILLPLPKGPLTRFFYFWNTQVNGFYLRRKRPITVREQKYVVMGCRHLTPSGRCSVYRTRPTVCRQWPPIEHFARPTILKGCGFQCELRKKSKL